MSQLRKGIFLNYLGILITFATGLLYTPILIRSLGQESYGIYALAFAIAGYFSILDLGIGNSIVRYISANMVNGNKEIEKKLIGFFLKIFSILSFFTLFIGVIISNSIESIVSEEFTFKQIHELKIMLIILCINFAIGFIFNTFSSVIQAYEKFVFLKITIIIRSISIPIISCIILVFSNNLIYLVLVMFFLNLLVFLLHLYYFYFKLKLSFSLIKIKTSIKKEIIKYSFIVFIVAIADKIYWQTDQILIGILSSPTNVAKYAVAIQIVMIFMSLSISINSVFLPKITKLVQNKNHEKELNKLYIKVSTIQTLVLGLVFSGFILFGKSFIYLWVGKSYEIVYTITLILVGTFFIDLIQNLGITVMQAKNKYNYRAYTLLVCSLLNVIVSVPVIMKWGLFGAAITTSLFVLIGNVIVMNIVFHKKLGLNMKRYWKKIGKILIVIILITIFWSFIVDMYSTNNWISLTSHIFIYFVFYFICILFLYLDRSQRVFIIKKLVRKNDSKYFH